MPHHDPASTGGGRFDVLSRRRPHLTREGEARRFEDIAAADRELRRAVVGSSDARTRLAEICRAGKAGRSRPRELLQAPGPNLLDADVRAIIERVGACLPDGPVTEQTLGVLSRKAIDEALGSSVDPLVRRARRRRRRARDELVEANMGLVLKEVRRHHDRLPRDELVQEGLVGLLNAIDRFDVTRGLKLSTYAVWWIRQAVDRAVERLGRTVRVPSHVHETIARVQRARVQLSARLAREPAVEELAEALEAPVHAVERAVQCMVAVEPLDVPAVDGGGELRVAQLRAPEDARPDHDLDRVDASDVAAHVLAGLSEAERSLVRKRFGLGNEAPHTLRDLSIALQLPQLTIRTEMRRTIRRLRARHG